MSKNFKTIYLMFYFMISLFYMEVILRISTSSALFSLGLLFSFIFSISFAVIFYLVCTLFKGRTSSILSCFLLVLSAFLFSSQLIYYRFFKTFYTFYSAGNGAQIFEFWKDILSTAARNSIWLILFFIPSILVVILRKKMLPYKRINRYYIILLIYFTVLSHIMGLAVIFSSSRDQYSAYDLYFKSSYSLLSVQRLGLITTMRLDLERLTTLQEPALEASAPVSSDVLPGDSSNLPDDENSNTDTGNNTTNDEKNNDNMNNTPDKTVREYNTLNIDFEKLISSEKNEVIKNMDKYFQSLQPTEKNDYTGKYKGYNLILITAEGFSPYAVREDVTPTLYKMVHEGYYFTNFYNPIWGVSTSDGEYVACTSLIPKSGVWSFYKSGSISMPFVMGNQLKNLSYKTTAYHDHTYNYYRRDVSHPNMGYEYKALGKGLDLKKTWPESDIEMMEKTIPEYINSEPFHTYYMTVSGHMQYTFAGNSMSTKNKQYVQNLPYSEPGKAYIASQIELDRALQYLLDQLEKAGIADKTLIALSPDHYPYGLEDKYIDELAGHAVEKNFELYKSTFILYTKGMKPEVIDKPCSSLDILPTLSNLLGLKYDSRLLMGRDIFSNSDPLVMFQNKSFITDKGRYNSTTGQFIPNEGVTVPEDYRKKISAIVDGKFYYSAKILENDYYKNVLKQ